MIPIIEDHEDTVMSELLWMKRRARQAQRAVKSLRDDCKPCEEIAEAREKYIKTLEKAVKEHM